MQKFRYIDDIENWLRPMDYEGFWHAVSPYNLVLQPREHCESQIAAGLVDRATVLDVLKSLASLELTELHGVKLRPATPWLKLVSAD